MISYTVAEGIAVLELSDPDSLNALTDDDMAALADLADRAGADPSVRAVVVTGAGKAFSVGGHVDKLEALMGAQSGERRAALAAWQESLLALERVAKPVVAALNGLCAAAGTSIALACDIRIAARSARIAFPSARVGLVTDLGDTYRLPRIVGAGWAKHYLLTGCWIDAERAERTGLVTAVFDDEGFRGEALRFVAEELVPRSVSAQGVLKRLVNDNSSASLQAALESERIAQALAYGGADVREGHRSIVERRPPSFG